MQIRSGVKVKTRKSRSRTFELLQETMSLLRTNIQFGVLKPSGVQLVHTWRLSLSSFISPFKTFLTSLTSQRCQDPEIQEQTQPQAVKERLKPFWPTTAGSSFCWLQWASFGFHNTEVNSAWLFLSEEGVRPITNLSHHHHVCSISIIIVHFIRNEQNLIKTLVSDVSTEFNRDRSKETWVMAHLLLSLDEMLS